MWIGEWFEVSGGRAGPEGAVEGQTKRRGRRGGFEEAESLKDGFGGELPLKDLSGSRSHTAAVRCGLATLQEYKGAGAQTKAEAQGIGTGVVHTPPEYEGGAEGSGVAPGSWGEACFEASSHVE